MAAQVNYEIDYRRGKHSSGGKSNVVYVEAQVYR